MLLSDLPADVIVIVLPYLDAQDFLAFTSCSRSLLPYRQEPTYWRNLTRSTFRIPPQPLLEADGARWLRLYKNLRTQTHVYTWGSNARGNLGHFRKQGRRQLHSTRTTGWPKEMVETEAVGVVADVQCGGWSTVLLNSIGQLWAVGVANGLRSQGIQPMLSPLTFPPAYPPTTNDRYEPSTAIREYSVGRCNVLGLSDDHRIWEWGHFRRAGQFVKFFTLDTSTNETSGIGTVNKVVAGWSKSSAYVLGTGIIYWSQSGDYDSEESPITDAFVVEHQVVPGTAYRQNQPHAVASGSMDAAIGEVVNYIFLDEYIVFTTHLKKLFAWRADDEYLPGIYPMELTSFYQENQSKIQDVQGSFQKFGVFTTDGAVLIGTRSMLDSQWIRRDLEDASRPPEIIPALQNCSVISLAFGDYHFHALHANGTITSYGTESQGCGALGLGGPNVSPLRGVFFTRRTTGDGQLRVPDWGDGRRTVWFEEEKARWISDTCQKGATSEASPRASRLAEDAETTKLVGEWFEREGRDWSAGPSGELAAKKLRWKENEAALQEEEEQGNGKGKAVMDEEDDEDDGIEAFSALKVAAAGWSSAALVLVNDAKAERVRRKYLIRTSSWQSKRNDTGDGSPARAGSPSPFSSSSSRPRATVNLGLGSSLTSIGRSVLSLVPRASSLFGEASTTTVPEGSEPGSSSSSSSQQQQASSSPPPPAAPGGFLVPTPTVRPSTNIHQAAGGAAGAPAPAGSSPVALPPAPTGPPATTLHANPVRNWARGLPAETFTARSVSDFDNDVYVWDDQPFPRLRYPDGSVMPGEVPLTPWKGGEPDFGSGQQPGREAS